MKLLFGLVMFIIGFSFAFWETIHFGNNLFPQSSAEIVCDSISLLLGLGGLFIIRQVTKK
jgi:hypothetical protein